MRRTLAVFPLAFSALLGCVTKSTHDQIVGVLEAERSELQTRVRDLSRSNQSLEEERVRLIDEMEDLREAREGLKMDVAKLERSRDLLTTHLRKREEKVEELSKLSGTYQGLVSDLEAEVSSGQIQIEQLREGLRLNLSQDILFRSGAVRLEPHGVEVLKKVARQLPGQDHNIEVQGHSDDVPLSNALASRWGSNWELAAARASQVVRLFEAEGVEPTRLRSVSYGENAPVADNDTPVGRARNRRIEIRLIPVDAASMPAAQESEADAAQATDADPS